MRSSLLVALVAVLALAATAVLPSPVRGDDDAGLLSWLQAKMTLRQANKALEEGRVGEAVPLYEEVLAGTEPGTDPHAQALYVLGFVYLGPEKAHSNPKRGGELLRELTSSYPNYAQQPEVAAALGWEQSLRQAQTSSRDQGAAVKALKAQVKKLEGELAEVRQELADTKAELAQKEEALRKIRDELLGDSGG